MKRTIRRKTYASGGRFSADRLAENLAYSDYADRFGKNNYEDYKEGDIARLYDTYYNKDYKFNYSPSEYKDIQELYSLGQGMSSKARNAIDISSGITGLGVNALGTIADIGAPGVGSTIKGIGNFGTGLLRGTANNILTNKVDTGLDKLYNDYMEDYNKYKSDKSNLLQESSSPIINFYRKGGIYIKPENRGKFNATKARTGKTTEELTHSPNPLTRKRAIFAQNARKWKHEDGGEMTPLYDSKVANPNHLKWLADNLVIAKGSTHEQGGIKLDPNNEVEDGELLFNVGGNTLVFSNKLKNGKKTFANEGISLATKYNQEESNSGEVNNYFTRNTAMRNKVTTLSKLKNLFNKQEVSKTNGTFERGGKIPPDNSFTEEELIDLYNIGLKENDSSNFIYNPPTRNLRLSDNYKNPLKSIAVDNSGITDTGYPYLINSSTDTSNDISNNSFVNNFPKSPKKNGIDMSKVSNYLANNPDLISNASLFLDNIGNLALTNRTPNVPKPSYLNNINLNTKLDVAPELSSIDSEVNTAVKNITEQVSDPIKANILVNQIRTRGLRAKADVYKNKYRSEQELSNQQKMLQAGIDEKNLSKLDAYKREQVLRRAGINQDLSQNLANLQGDFTSMINNKNLKNYQSSQLDILREQYGETGSWGYFVKAGFLPPEKQLPAYLDLKKTQPNAAMRFKRDAERQGINTSNWDN